MAVYGHIYRTYEGEITEPRLRFLVLTRYALSDLFASRLFLAAFLLCLAPVLVVLVRIYLGYNLDFVAAFGISPEVVKKLLAIDPAFFRNWILIPQATLAYLLASRAAPAIVSRDLTNNAMPIFLARPISRWEYVSGKGLAVLAVLGAITLVPALVLFLFQGAVAGLDWFGQYFWIAFSLAAASLLWMVVLTAVGLTLTAIVRRGVVAQLSFFALPFIATAIGATINANFDTHAGDLLQLPMLLWAVWKGLLRLPIGEDAISPLSAWMVFAAIVVVCLVVLARRIRAYEVER